MRSDALLPSNLKLEALELINPASVGRKHGLTVDYFRKLLKESPELEEAGEAWLKRHGLR